MADLGWSPVSPSNRRYPRKLAPAYPIWSGVRRSVDTLVSEQCPGDAGCLIGHGDQHDVCRPPRQELVAPAGTRARLGASPAQHAARILTDQQLTIRDKIAASKKKGMWMGGPVPLHLPPLDSLRFFEATARHQSFVLAGKELGVTAAAVGHRIRTLEKHLGAELFERRRRSVHLNRRGRVGARTLSVAIFLKNTVSVGPARYGDGVARRVFRIGEDVSVGLVHSAEQKPVFSGSGAKCFDIGNIEVVSLDGAAHSFMTPAEECAVDRACIAAGLNERVAGAATIVRDSLNKPEDFILAVVEFDGDEHSTHYGRTRKCNQRH